MTDKMLAGLKCVLSLYLSYYIVNLFLIRFFTLSGIYVCSIKNLCEDGGAVTVKKEFFDMLKNRVAKQLL